jgi:predicted RNA-binding Zn-ribbon protein involved in translation (DUF1610 family)
MTDKAPDLCPRCQAKDTNDRRHKVYFHNGHPRCAVHGCVLRAGEWEFTCEECGENADELHGYMVPHLCASCFEKTKAQQRAEGYVCHQCGEPRIACPH